MQNLDCLLCLVGPVQNGGPEGQCIVVIRLPGQDFIGLLLCLVQLPCQHKEAPEVNACIQQFRIQLHRLAVIAKGLAPFLLLLCHTPQVIIRGSRLGIDLQYILEFDRGLFVIFLFKIRLATLQVLGLAFLRSATTGQNAHREQHCNQPDEPAWE